MEFFFFKNNMLHRGPQKSKYLENSTKLSKNKIRNEIYDKFCIRMTEINIFLKILIFLQVWGTFPLNQNLMQISFLKTVCNKSPKFWRYLTFCTTYCVCKFSYKIIKKWWSKMHPLTSPFSPHLRIPIFAYSELPHNQ